MLTKCSDWPDLSAVLQKYLNIISTSELELSVYAIVTVILLAFQKSYITLATFGKLELKMKSYLRAGGAGGADRRNIFHEYLANIEKFPLWTCLPSNSTKIFSKI